MSRAVWEKKPLPVSLSRTSPDQRHAGSSGLCRGVITRTWGLWANLVWSPVSLLFLLRLFQFVHSSTHLLPFGTTVTVGSCKILLLIVAYFPSILRAVSMAGGSEKRTKPRRSLFC